MIINNLGENEQMLLREIKEANGQLLKVVSEKNALRQQMRERAVSGDWGADGTAFDI
jgi:hypothetical protein